MVSAARRSIRIPLTGAAWSSIIIISVRSRAAATPWQPPRSSSTAPLAFTFTTHRSRSSSSPANACSHPVAFVCRMSRHSSTGCCKPRMVSIPIGLPNLARPRNGSTRRSPTPRNCAWPISPHGRYRAALQPSGAMFTNSMAAGLFWVSRCRWAKARVVNVMC